MAFDPKNYGYEGGSSVAIASSNPLSPRVSFRPVDMLPSQVQRLLPSSDESPSEEQDTPRRIGGGASFSGPTPTPDFGGDKVLLAKYLQARLRGMNRATVDPRVNQMRVMNSKEWALAQAMGINTPYGSRDSVDVTYQEKQTGKPGMQGEFARSQMKKFAESTPSIDDGFARDSLEEFGATSAQSRSRGPFYQGNMPSFNDGSTDYDSELAELGGGTYRGPGGNSAQGPATPVGTTPYIGQRPKKQ